MCTIQSVRIDKVCSAHDSLCLILGTGPATHHEDSRLPHPGVQAATFGNRCTHTPVRRCHLWGVQQDTKWSSESAEVVMRLESAF